jgi:site-specific recombinase XerD
MAYIGRFRDKWRAQIQRGGIRASKTFYTKREAQAWVIEQEAKETLAHRMSLTDAIDRYVTEVSIHKRDSVETEKRRLGAMLEYFGDVPLDSITPDDISRWRTQRMQTVKGSTVLRDSGLYRNLFRVAMNEWGVVKSNPFTGVRLPKAEPARVQIWKWQKIKRVLRAGQRVGGKTMEVTQAFHIALRTGMRLKEAVMAPECFDKQRRVVDLKSSKTAAKGETVPLTKQGYRLMLKMPKFEVSEARASMLFCHLLNNLLIKDLQFRDARATALTMMARRMDVLTLARISRHKDLKMLLVYYRESPEDISRRI